MAQISSEDEAERAEEDDIVEDLEFVEHSLPSLVSLTSHNGGITRKRSNGLIQAKAQIERKISVSSIMSDDSFSMEHLEEAGQAIGAAVGFSKVASGLRESRRRKSMSRQDSICDIVRHFVPQIRRDYCLSHPLVYQRKRGMQR